MTKTIQVQNRATENSDFCMGIIEISITLKTSSQITFINKLI